MAAWNELINGVKSCRNCANLGKKIWHCTGCDNNSLWTPMEAPKTDYVAYSKKTPIKTTYSFPRIKKVLFSAPATIVFWDDNTKTVVKCSENDDFDWEKGLAMAISKKFFGNEGNYYNNFKQWEPEEVDMVYPTMPESIINSFKNAGESLEKLKNSIINKHKGE